MYDRCQATKKDGRPCGAPPALVDPETGYCRSHRPGAKERLSRQGTKGGEATSAKHKLPGMSDDELPPLQSHEDAKEWLEKIGRAVLTQKITDRTASAAIRGVSEWIKAHEGQLTAKVVDELQNEVDRLKKELAGARRLRTA